MAESLETDYLRQNRQGQASQAGDELLSRMGLDRDGNPLAAPTPQPQAGTPQVSTAEHAAGAADRIRKIRADQAKEQQPSFMRDVVMGTAKEVPRAVVGGVRDAVKEMLESADALAGFFAEKTGTEKGGAFGKLAENVPEIVGESETPGGQLLRGIAQFGTGFVAGGKGLKAAGMAAGTKKALAAGAFADVAAFDPADPNISNLIQSVPGLANPVNEFLATEPGDSEGLNRFKRAIEGLGLGVATDVVVNLARGWRANRSVKRVETAFEQAQRPPAEAPVMPPDVSGVPPNAAGAVDVVRPLNSVDIPVGPAGRGGVIQSERLALPAPGQFTLTADELAENLIKERNARMALEGNPTLQAAQEAVTIKNEVKGNPTLRAAYETTLKGESEEAIIEGMVKKAKPELQAVAKEVFTSAKEPAEVSAEVMARGKEFLGGGGETPALSTMTSEPAEVGAEVMARGRAFLNEKGEISQEGLYALARAAVGGALGLTQGETLEDRITNAVLGAGAGAALKPALLKKLIGAMEKVAPAQMKVVKSFDPPALDVTKKGITRKPPKPAGPLTIASEADTKAFLAVDPSAIEVGNKAIKVNWSEIGDESQIDDVIKTLTKLNEESIDVARRGVQSDVKRQQLANMLGITEEDMLRRRQGQALNAEQSQAFIDVYGSSVKELDRLATALKSGEAVESQLRLQLGRTTALTQTLFGARAEAGRALRVWGQAAQQVNATGLAQQVDLLTLGGKNIADVPAERLADMILALDNPTQKISFIRHATELGQSAMLEAWMNGLLSNPVTHVANITSNTLTTGVSILERSIAGMLGKEVARAEAGAMIHGLSTGWQDALQLARKAFAEGTSQMGFSKLETPRARAITAENFGVSGGIGRAVDMLGSVVTTPGRSLMAADDFFKGINYRMEMHAQAARQATNEGLSGTALAKRIDDLVRDTDFASLVKDQAEAFANYQTFNQQLGNLGTGVIQFLNDHPTGRVLLPFVRTPVNIAKYTIERTPLVNLVMKQVRADLAAGGIKRDMALAKTTFGGLTYLAAGSLALGGFSTGGGPVNKDLRDLKRATGWQPYSIKIGDKYISYSRLDPIGFMFGLAADMVEKGGELNEMDIDGLTAAGVMALKDTFINKTYMKGVSDAFEAITSPNRRWQNYFERLAGSLVPAGAANIARQIDPTLREVNSAADAIYSRLPGFSSGLPPRRNIWGDPIMLEGGVGPDLVSPFYTSTEKDSPVTKEILRLELGVNMPPNYIFGTRPSDSAFTPQDPRQGIKLTPEEYDRYVVLAGQEMEIGGKNLPDKLFDLMSTPSYAAMSETSKKTLIQRYFNIYRDAAEIQLMKEFPELEEAFKEKLGERREALRPGTDTGASPFQF